MLENNNWVKLYERFDGMINSSNHSQTIEHTHNNKNNKQHKENYVSYLGSADSNLSLCCLHVNYRQTISLYYLNSD